MDVVAIQKRTLRVLVLGQLAAAAALSSAVTVGAFVIQRILGQDTPWGGIATATVTLGTAFMSQYLSRLMSRRGRRDGLRLGYLLAIVGGFVAGVGAETKTLVVFLVGLFVYGSGQASNLLSRYAATDLAPPAMAPGRDPSSNPGSTTNGHESTRKGRRRCSRERIPYAGSAKV